LEPKGPPREHFEAKILEKRHANPASKASKSEQRTEQQKAKQSKASAQYENNKCSYGLAYHISQLFLILPVPPIILALRSSSHPIIQTSNVGTAECAERLN